MWLERMLGSKFAAEVAIPDTSETAHASGSASIFKRKPVDDRSWPGVIGLVRPHSKALLLGIVAVLGEGAANLLEPWPLKLVFDSFSQSGGKRGWLNHWIRSAIGTDKIALLEFAAIAVIGIALLDAICFYAEKYLTTSVGQWVMHDLRRLLYAHIQDLSLGYHTQRRTGELISRLTTDIDAIQTFIVSNLLGFLVDFMTLLGMATIMSSISSQRDTIPCGGFRGA